MGGLPETTAITNQAQSQAADLAIATSSDDVVAKPQVVATALKSSADIQDYTTVCRRQCFQRSRQIWCHLRQHPLVQWP